MKIRFLFLIIALIFFVGNLSAQDINLRTFDYSKADSIALNFPKGKYRTYKEIVEPLTINLETDQEKFRAIYRWIADNVAYSFSNKSDNPGRALTQRKAVCAGYSSLLKEMCNDAGLECNVIDGWAKIKPSDIGQATKETSHAWNEVQLNGKWYLTDLTWASGWYDFKNRKFYKDFDSAYFLPTPEFFIKQHFPMDKKNQMLATPVKKSVFNKSCVWYEDAAKYSFTVLKPTKGHFHQNIKKDFTITVLLKKEGENKDILKSFNFLVDDKTNDTQDSLTIVKTDNVSDQFSVTIKCRFPKDLKGMYGVDLCYGGEQVSGFMINFH
jgi:hypothetical protein